MHLKIFVAVILGVLTGGMIALRVNPMFWWVGMIIGGAVGYLSYEFRAVLQAIHRAYHAVHGWHPDTLYWSDFTRATFGIVGMFQTLILIMMLFFPLDVKAKVFMFLALHALIVPMSAMIAAPDHHKFPDPIFFRYRNTNPISAILWCLPRGIFMALKWAVPRTSVGIALAGRFFVFLFREIHSEMRLLCAFYSAVGAAWVYFSGSLFWGVAIAGILATLNYEVISKRLLHIRQR